MEDTKDNKEVVWDPKNPQKNVTPPWDPFNREKHPHKKRGLNIRERKFLLLISTTGNLSEAVRGVYKCPTHPDKKIAAAMVHSYAIRKLEQIRKKEPELVAKYTYEDITPDFVRRELMKMYNNPDTPTHERVRLLELMGKTHAMFTDKHQVDTKVKDAVDTIYQESDSDFPVSQDNRITRDEIDSKFIPKA